MRLASPVVLALAAALSGIAAVRAETVGLAAPLSGFAAALGAQMRDGARVAADGAGTPLVIADTACSAEGGASAARTLVEAGVSVVTGFLCTEAIDAALPVLTAAGIAVITPGVRADALTDRRARTGNLVWRMAPRADAEAKAAAALLLDRWRTFNFAIVDDGTIYGRDLAESLRLAAEMEGHKPVFFDTFRPQLDNQIGLVGRLRKAGATHVFVGGDRNDIAVLGRDAAKLGLDLAIAGGEALLAAEGEVELAPGTLMVGLAGPQASTELAAAFAARGIVPEGYVLSSHAAVEIALAVAGGGRATMDQWRARLEGPAFDTVAGRIVFDENGDREGNPYRLFVWNGEEFVSAD